LFSLAEVLQVATYILWKNVPQVWNQIFALHVWSQFLFIVITIKKHCHMVKVMNLILYFATCILKFCICIFQGAATTCYVGLNPQLKGVTGKYFADCNVEKTSKLARSEELAKQLWDFGEELIKSAK